METKVQFFIFIVLFSINISVFYAAPTTTEATETTTEDFNSTEELYVIRAIVYEVGILTDEDNSTDDASEESHEEVDLKFYDPAHNGSLIDLSNIPVPVQTNVSGQVITALAPVNLGSIQLPIGETETKTGSDVTETEPMFLPSTETNSTTYPLHNALVSVTTNVSTTNSQTGKDILNGLPSLLNLPHQFNNAISNSSSSDF